MAESRNELLLRKLNGEDVQLEPPMSRIEKLYYKLLGYDVELEEPQSREEALIKQYIDSGGGGGGGGGDLSTAKVTFINSNPTGPYTVTILSHINSYSHDTLGMATYIVGSVNAEVDVPLYKGCYVIGIDACINLDEIDVQVMPTSTGGVEIDFENGNLIVTGNGSFTCAGKK